MKCCTECRERRWQRIGRPVLRVRDLEVRFAVKREGLFSKPAQLHAVDGVSFDVAPGRTLGLVGESRIGKVHHRARRGRG